MAGIARFFAEENDITIRCDLCPRRCKIKSGNFGLCRVRGNKNGKSLIPFFGFISTLALDPIEKKPLYHFRPGTTILSAGFAGCNLHCPFCQNWHISQSTDIPGKYIQPGELVSAALHENSQAIAYTYSEPLVHAEFLLDCMKLAHDHGIANVLVTNGCINPEAAEEILQFTDAANIDLKCFSRETYTKILGGDLDAVLEFIRSAHSKGIHTEITTLVVPGLNDSFSELDDCAGFIASLNTIPGIPNIPWHLSAYHPDYRWNAPPTDPGFLQQIKERVHGNIAYVYTGNIPGEENNTSCFHCGNLLVRRRGYNTETPGLEKPSNGSKMFKCSKCGKITGIVC